MFENSHTSNLFIRKKSDLVEFFIWGRELFLGGKFFGGDIEVFSGGKVLRGKSPESRVQGPVQLLEYAILFVYLTLSLKRQLLTSIQNK